MRKNGIRFTLSIIGILIIVATLITPVNYRGMDSPMWGLLLGAGLIILPFTAAAYFLAYALMVLIPFGLAFVCALIGVELFGKDSIPAFVGLFAGGFYGLKFVISDSFDKLLDPLRKLAEKDNS